MTESERRIIECAKQIAKMKRPSIERLLLDRGFSFEAEKIAELVRAAESVEQGLDSSLSKT